MNIGIGAHPKIMNISRMLSLEAKHKYTSLMEEYTYAFSWIYSDLKAYDTSIIQHTIPIKNDGMPFKQKLWIINPKMLPLIEK